MTVIYDNVATDEGNHFIVYNDIGRVGGYLMISYSPARNRFILDPEPIAEGVNHNK